ncbi:hypothetical protein FA15DRAFT_758013 [Coprinopsis marcescibilis]|uniref:F-box domain-containing protein n=1 Tax=Coprinopsis marcescibilis TaxID=230819 RepID=A0A5C3KPX2_COPMA|nr:hypothetical protein FA15DRAFT_758013 [Coprinopsis marcescibilis]
MATVPWSLASHVIGTISSWLGGRHQRSLSRNTTTVKITNITSLPEELIIAVMEFSEWSDILRMRRCCKVLHSTSQARSVWVALLHRYYLTVFPRPFLLPKPLEHCASSELEALITGWFRDVRDFSDEFSPPQTSTLQVNIKEHKKLGTIPGGRFMLYSAHEGSVYYQDPQNVSNAPPILLIQSPFYDSLTRYEVDMNFSFEPLFPRNSDFLKCEALEDQWFPRSLNLVLAWHSYETMSPDVRETVIEVWTLLPQVVGGELVGYLGQRLSSFNEDPYGVIISCAILGDKVAYGMPGATLANNPAVVVVNWAGLNRGSFPDHRVYLPIDPAENLTLLPESRIMVVYHQSVGIWSLAQGTPSYALPPSRRQRVLSVVPAWMKLFDCPIVFGTGTNFFIRNSIRIVIPTLRGLYGMLLPCFSQGTHIDRPIEVVRLVQGKYKLAGADNLQWYGYRKGASGFNRSHLVLQYSWPDDIPFAGIARIIPEQHKKWVCTYFHFDEALNRIQTFNEHTLQYHIVDLSSQPVI